ncbi:MAG: TetR/AcrR family transcriptional regulator [Alphaproteobacteria bacterium]|nr:TetR/AcrR family transcriptional regulator [Alphaproteobacteria bacterium]
MRLKTHQRRVEIMQAALEIFLVQGIEHARIEDICTRAKASVGSIYHHFGDKKSLASALYLEALTRYLDPLDKKVKGAPSARAFITVMVTHHLSWARENPSWARYLLSVRREFRSQDFDAKVAALNDRYLSSSFDLLKKYVARGEIRKLPRYLYAPLMMGPCQELIRQYLENNGRNIPDEAVLIVADTIWRGLRADSREENL